MKANNEQELAKAIMEGELSIELDKSLSDRVSNILDPIEVVWKSILAVFVSALCIVTSPSIFICLSWSLPVVLAICGGTGGVVFVALGAEGTLCAFRLLVATKDVEVLKRLRTYQLKDNVISKHS